MPGPATPEELVRPPENGTRSSRVEENERASLASVDATSEITPLDSPLADLGKERALIPENPDGPLPAGVLDRSLCAWDPVEGKWQTRSATITGCIPVTLPSSEGANIRANANLQNSDWLPERTKALATGPAPAEE